jgi:hypothetical protein
MIVPSDIRKDKKWCFKCHAPNWSPSHKCKDKKFYHYEINSNDNNKDEEAVETSTSNTKSDNEEPSSQNTILTLSIVATTSISQAQTLKVFGYITKTKAMVLIDSGSSHNFIDTIIYK